jgi:membrane protease YdiL (CAAX protease family)
MGLYVLANFGERNSTARLVALITGGALASFAVAIGLRLILGGDQRGIPEAIAGVLALVYLWAPVQRAVARVIPVRPGSPVVYLTIVVGLQLIAQQLISQVQPATPVTISALLIQDIPFFILSFVGVGIFVRRSVRQAIQRLGLIAPHDKRWWFIAVIGVIAFIAVSFGIERLADKVTPSTQQQLTNVTNVLYSRFSNPIGVILLGVIPGIVEETLFRGALVPRLGIVVTAGLFAAVHTQYAITFATLEVFVLGIGLGWLRVRSGSTLPCMVTHAGYNIAVGVLAYLTR